MNLLLAALPRPDFQRLLESSDQVELQVSQLLCAPGQRLRHVFFPTAGLIAVIAPLSGRPDFAIGVIGDEGMLGLWSMLGASLAPFRCKVQQRGTALRMPVPTFLRHIARSAALRRELNCYVYALLLQRAQAAGCASNHVVEERLARWLLMTRDRLHSDDFCITHEALAGILGVRRAGVSSAASSLQTRRLIRYSRGDITIVDRPALETAACSCYAADRQIYATAMAGGRRT